MTSTLSGLLSQCSCEWVIHRIGRRDAVEVESAGMSQSLHLHSLWNCRLYLRGPTSRSYNWAGARSEHGDQPLALRDRYAVVHMHSTKGISSDCHLPRRLRAHSAGALDQYPVVMVLNYRESAQEVSERSWIHVCTATMINKDLVAAITATTGGTICCSDG